MFNEVFNQVTGIFDRRFLLNAFFPCLIFWGLLGVIGVVGSGWELLKLLQNWNQQDVVLKTLEIIGLITLVIFSASLLSSQSDVILQFYQEPWKFPLKRQFARIGIARHQANLETLDVRSRMQRLAQQMRQVGTQFAMTQDSGQKQSLQQEMDRLIVQEKQLRQQQFALQEANYRYYPQPNHVDQVMPTRLDNILQSARLYPFDRYNIDSELVWARLYHLLPEHLIQTITESRIILDFNLSIATLSGLFSLISGIWLLVMKSPGWLFLLCLWGGSLIAWLAYCTAIGSAVLYAEQVKVCFDLYRHELVKQLRLKPATTPEAEKQQWQEIRQLFYAGQAPATWQYIDPEPKKEGVQNG